MTKIPKSEAKKPRVTSPVPFKPDIRLANAVIGAIAFLQKASLQATPKIIKKYMLERSRNPKTKNLEQLPGYLTRGLELGILKKSNNGAFKIGELEMVRKRPRKRKQEKIIHDAVDHKTSVVVIKAPNEAMQDFEQE